MLFLSKTDIPSSINNIFAFGNIAIYDIAILNAYHSENLFFID